MVNVLLVHKVGDQEIHETDAQMEVIEALSRVFDRCFVLQNLLVDLLGLCKVLRTDITGCPRTHVLNLCFKS